MLFRPVQGMSTNRPFAPFANTRSCLFIQAVGHNATKGAPTAMSNPFLQGSFTTIGAIGWAQAMPRRADGAGATMCRGLSLKVATQKPDRSPAFPQRKSRKKCSMRSKASLHPDVQPRELVRCRLSVPGGLSAQAGNYATRYLAMKRCSMRSSESQSARRRLIYGSGCRPRLPRSNIDHSLETAVSLPAPRDRSRRT